MFRTFSLLALLLIPCCWAATAAATIYSFVDQKGVLHFTNVPGDPRCKPFFRPEAKRDDHNHYKTEIYAAAQKHKIDPLLITSIIKAESGFDRLAVSAKGAKGLMQLMPATINDMQVADPFNAQQNISGGSRYFKRLLHRFNNDTELALAAYNAGPERVEQLGRVPRIPETREYIRRVLADYESLKTSSQTTPF